MKALLLACLVLAAALSRASADVLYPNAIVLDLGLASGQPAGFPWGAYAVLGEPIVVTCRVASVSVPFDDLLPIGDYGITCVFEGALCTQAGMFDGQCSGGIYGAFEGGSVAFYLDTTPDMNPTDPATFRDGELVLLAETSYINVGIDDPYQNCPWEPDQPDMSASFTFTGGSWFSRVSDRGTGFSGDSRSELYDSTPSYQALGYIFQVDGTFDVYGPVATEQTTWGNLKAMYR